MRLCFFTIPVHGGKDAAEALNRFLATHRILSIDRSFVQDGGNSAWSLCIGYDAAEGAGRPAPGAKRPGKLDYREVLSETDFALFARLRALRKDLAEAEGVPAYALFTNEQLAAMVQNGARSPASLLAIDGIGEARVGALTSQHFANAYLGGLDRFLLERCKVRGMVRYMDDLVWWGDDKAAVRAVMADVRHSVGDELDLAVKEPVRIGRSRPGLAFCGYRVVPGRLLLSRRWKRRYAIACCRWEAAFLAGRIGAREVQAGCCGALAITAHAEAAAWRREHLRRRPLADALDRL